MAEKDDWWTSPTVGESGRTVIVSGRRDVEKFRSKEKYGIRIEIRWKYESSSDGFPSDTEARLMEQATDAFQAALKGKNTAIMTGIYTGDGERDWVFYTFSTEVFGSFLNRALSGMPLLPITVYAENDPSWAEYDEMKSLSEILPGD